MSTGLPICPHSTTSGIAIWCWLFGGAFSTKPSVVPGPRDFDGKEKQHLTGRTRRREGYSETPARTRRIRKTPPHFLDDGSFDHPGFSGEVCGLPLRPRLRKR